MCDFCVKTLSTDQMKQMYIEINMFCGVGVTLICYLVACSLYIYHRTIYFINDLKFIYIYEEFRCKSL